MNYGSGTVDRTDSWRLTDAAGAGQRLQCMWTHHMAALLCAKLGHGRHLKSM